MRKLNALVIAVVVASFLSPATVSASGSAPVPIPRGPHDRARLALHPAPSTSTRRPAVASPAPIACDGQFDLVASPNGTGNNYLDSVSAVSANDVWAVGNSTNSAGQDRTLAEHWNGSSWTVFPTVNTGSLHNDLRGVSAIASNNVWAVGAYEINHTAGTIATIAEHWNGSAWSKVSTPNPSGYSFLNGVTAISAGDVWAVGAYYDSFAGAYLTLIEHFNGTSWTVFTGGNITTTDGYNQLYSVSAFSSTDVWAVGSNATFSGIIHPLAEHWNGAGWSVVSTDQTSVADNEIFGVTALEAQRAVGVGYLLSSGFYQGATWNLLAGGGSTTAARSPSVSSDNILEGVDRSSNSLWAVGFNQNATMVWPATWDATGHTLAWAASPGISASPSLSSNVLFGVDAVSPSVFWSTGYETSVTVDHTLAEAYCGLQLDLSAPATASAGVPFSMTVTAQDPSSSTDTGYAGTVHFISSDSNAALPGDYTFVPADAGVHVFSGVTLDSPYNQPSTITVKDTATPFVNDTASITVSCAGPCQSAAGTPGGRTTSQGPPGVPGTRLAARPGAVTPGTRLPAAAPPRVNRGAESSIAPSKVTAGTPAVALHVARSAPVQGAAPAEGVVLAARAVPASPGPGRAPWYLALLVPLLLISLVLLVGLRRLRS